MLQLHSVAISKFSRNTWVQRFPHSPSKIKSQLLIFWGNLYTATYTNADNYTSRGREGPSKPGGNLKVPKAVCEMHTGESVLG